MVDFKLISLKLRNNNIFPNTSFDFLDEEDKPNKPYSTVIIGANGTGKSNLLRIIVLLFEELNSLKEKDVRTNKVDGSFELKYKVNGYTYLIKYGQIDVDSEISNTTRTEKKVQAYCNDQPINFKAVELPVCILTLSNTITDKFPLDNEDFNIYNYLGVRANSNTARTTTFINKTIDLLYQTLPNEEVLPNLAKALNFLNYDKNLFISYYPRYKQTFFTGDLTQETFIDFFQHFWNYTRRSKHNPPWSINKFKAIYDKTPFEIPKLVNLCNKICKYLEPEFEGSRTTLFYIDVFINQFSNDELLQLRTLHSLDILSYPYIGFNKGDKYFELQHTSSGEYHFISGIIGLLAKITDNSLIIIDEPENSLHPNWQMKYIGFIKSIFSQYKSCHFIIASHSHFMVSDLEPKSSFILGLVRNQERRTEAISIPTNTYGWSAEEILLKIFQVSSTRNYYLSEKLETIFELISKEPSKKIVIELREKVADLKKIDFSGLSKEDPMKDVINSLLKKFSNG
jgi:predicted ATPase